MSSYFSDLNPTTDATSLPSDSISYFKDLMPQQEQNDAERFSHFGLMPNPNFAKQAIRGLGLGRLLPDETKQEAESSPTGRLTGEAIKYGTLGRVLAPVVGTGIVGSAATGAVGKTATNLMEEGELPSVGEVAKEALLFGGTHSAFNVAAKGVKLMKSLAQSGKKSIATAAGKNKLPDVLPPFSNQKSVVKIGQEHGLRPFAGLHVEPKYVTPVITKQRAAKVVEGLDLSVQNAVKSVMEEKIPLYKLMQRGEAYNLENAYNKLYDKGIELAKKSKNPISTQPILEQIDKTIASIQEIPSPSEAKKKVIDKLLQKRKELTIENPESKKPLIQLLDANGKPLPVKEVPARIPREIDADTARKQFHSWNEDRSNFYKNTETSHAAKELDNTYKMLTQSIVDASEQAGNKEFADVFRFANRVYSQDLLIKKTLQTMEDAFSKPNGFQTLMNNKSARRSLLKDLGPEAVEQFKEIATYQKAVLDKMKHFTNIKEYPGLARYGKLISESPGRIAGHFYTSDNVRSQYVKMLKAFGQKDYSRAEKEALELMKLTKTDPKTIDVKPKE